MEFLTITKTITQPVDVINDFADSLGYQTIVPNPNYLPAVGNETIDDTSAEQVISPAGVPVYPQIANPDYVPALGEPTMENPQSRLEFVSERFDAFVSEKFFGQFAARNAEKIKLEEAKVLTQATVEAIKASITTVIE
jgi:hypothetical protein